MEKNKIVFSLNGFMLFLLSLAAKTSLVLAVYCFFVLFVLPQYNNLSKPHIPTLMKMIDVSFVAFLISMFSSIFFKLIDFIKENAKPYIIKIIFTIGVLFTVFSYSILLYDISLIRTEINHVKKQDSVFRETLSFLNNLEIIKKWALSKLSTKK